MPNAQTPHPGKLLVVDDEQVIVDVVAEYFTSHGLEVVAALEGNSALALADTAHPDVVLLDLRMPGMSGEDVLHQLRLRWPALPVIILSAIGDEERAKRTLQDGAFDYVAKPFDLEHLRQCVDAALLVGGSGVSGSEEEGGEA